MGWAYRNPYETLACVKGIGHSEVGGIDVSIILKCTSEKWRLSIWIRLNCLRIRTSGGLF